MTRDIRSYFLGLKEKELYIRQTQETDARDKYKRQTRNAHETYFSPSEDDETMEMTSSRCPPPDDTLDDPSSKDSVSNAISRE